MKALYDFHDPVSILRRVIKRRGGGTWNSDALLDYHCRRLESIVSRNDIDPALTEFATTFAFHDAPQFLFVTKSLTTFLDGMHINNVPLDYIKPIWNMFQAPFVFVWGDGSKCLCNVTTGERLKSIKTRVINAINRIYGFNCCLNTPPEYYAIHIYADAPESINVAGVATHPLLTVHLEKDAIEDIVNFDFAQMDVYYEEGRLSRQENNTMHLAATRLIKTLIYIASYPDMLRDGIVGDCALSELQPKHIKKSSRTLLVKEEHRSVASHLRHAFFRLYPIKRDGTRTPGLVFVKSTIVKGNAKTVDKKEQL